MSVDVDPGALSAITSLEGVAVTSVNVDPGALLLATSFHGTQYNSIIINPGVLSVITSLEASQYTNVNVAASPLSITTSLQSDYLFIDKSEVGILVYAGNQLKMNKTISTASILSGDVIKRDKMHVNVQGTHLTLKITSEKLGRNMYLLDLNVVISIISGR